MLPDWLHDLPQLAKETWATWRMNEFKTTEKTAGRGRW